MAMRAFLVDVLVECAHLLLQFVEDMGGDGHAGGVALGILLGFEEGE